MRQFQCVPTTYVTEIKESYFEIYTKQVSCPLAFLFKHLTLPIRFKIPVMIWQKVYIYMTAISPNLNYAFANLVVAWL